MNQGQEYTAEFWNELAGVLVEHDRLRYPFINLRG